MEEVDADRMLAELVRIAKPGGRVAVGVRAVDRGQWTNLPLPAPLKEKIEEPVGVAGAAAACTRRAAPTTASIGASSTPACRPSKAVRPGPELGAPRQGVVAAYRRAPDSRHADTSRGPDGDGPCRGAGGGYSGLDRSAIPLRGGHKAVGPAIRTGIIFPIPLNLGCRVLAKHLMRPPVVKGQRYPHERFFAFFRLVNASIVGHRQRVLT